MLVPNTYLLTTYLLTTYFEAVWRMGTAEAFRLRNRRGMMEDIIRLRRELGAVVFQWVRGLGGVHCNAHADMIAKACLDEGVEDSVGRCSAPRRVPVPTGRPLPPVHAAAG